MADGGFGQDAVVTRRIDGAVLVFQRLDGLWMIDRLGDPANGNDWDEVGEVDDTGAVEACATAIARDELRGLDAGARRAFHARQLRKLGLHPGGTGAAALWRIITDFDRFDPWAA